MAASRRVDTESWNCGSIDGNLEVRVEWGVGGYTQEQTTAVTTAVGSFAQTAAAWLDFGCQSFAAASAMIRMRNTRGGLNPSNNDLYIGTQRIPGIHVSQMTQFGGDGYYESTAVLPLP